VGLRAGLDRCVKSRPSPGFDSRTVHPVASCYTNCATRPTTLLRAHHILYFSRLRFNLSSSFVVVVVAFAAAAAAVTVTIVDHCR
jgi:hypothetical protein